MTLSKYCRASGINLIGLSKNTGKSVHELRQLYVSNIIEFEMIVSGTDTRPQYDFKYKCFLNLKSGRDFAKTGTIKAVHQRDAIEKVGKLFDCKKITVSCISGFDRLIYSDSRESKDYLKKFGNSRSKIW